MVAYTWFFVVVLIIAGALITSFLASPVNQVTGQMNKQISAGHVSEQTKTTYTFQLTLLGASAGIILIGLVLHAWTRTHEVSNSTGGEWP